MTKSQIPWQTWMALVYHESHVVSKLNWCALSQYVDSESWMNELDLWPRQWKWKETCSNLRWEESRTNTSIREEMELPANLMRVKDYKWKWAGHVVRAERDPAWDGCMKDWIPPGKRKRGRPRKRWEDNIRQVVGPNWIEKATDRHQWNNMREAYISISRVMKAAYYDGDDAITTLSSW